MFFLCPPDCKTSRGNYVTLDYINKTDLTSLMLAAADTDSSLTLANWLNLVAVVACLRKRQ